MTTRHTHLLRGGSVILRFLGGGSCLQSNDALQRMHKRGARYLGRGKSFKRSVGVLLPARKGGFEHQLVVGGDAHGLHQLRDVVHVEHVDDVAAEAVADDGGGVRFKRCALARHLPVQ